jgi:hypothetical protein
LTSKSPYKGGPALIRMVTMRAKRSRARSGIIDRNAEIVFEDATTGATFRVDIKELVT